MDAFLLDLFMQLPMPAKLAVLIVFPVIAAASGWIAGTETPPPNTTAGKIYRLIEFAAVAVGKAKQIGIPVPTATTLESAAVAEFAASQKEGRPYSMENVMKSLTNTAAAVALFMVAAVTLSACATNPTTGQVTLTPGAQAVVNVACTFDQLAPGAVVRVGAIVQLVNPAQAGNVALATQADQLAHPAVQSACAALGASPAAVTIGTASPPAVGSAVTIQPSS